MKYQLSVSIGNIADKNSASTKAVKDCAQLLSLKGYKDNNLFYSEDTSAFVRYLSIFKALCSFFIVLQKGSVVAVQYPMLNNVFKHFIKIARLKKVKFFCVIHDIESLRLGGLNKQLVKKEVSNLNYYDYLIVHNTFMLQWLRDKGAITNMTPLGVFDYILGEEPTKSDSSVFSKSIVFAGNLAKSNFIYHLGEVSGWDFRVYGPNYNKEKSKSKNVNWKGEYSPDQVVYELDGDFGLIWDGDRTDKCDEILGNYLKYNNPHKFSLYLAAGLPVIAPKNSAIGKMIANQQLGILVNSLSDLNTLEVTEENYKTYKANCDKVKNKIIKGEYFLQAIQVVEKEFNIK